MNTIYIAIDQRLRDLRALRQRCAGALRAGLQDVERLPVSAASQDRIEALQVEREAAQAALQALLTPALIPPPVRDRVGREIEAAMLLSLREEDPPPLRERNRSIVPRKQVVVEEVPPAPQAPLEPEPAAPVLSGWRLSRARRQGLVTA